MAYATINKPNNYFDTKLYTGNGSTQTITGLNFAPEFVWLKDRGSGGYSHAVFDKVRGVQKRIFTNSTNAEDTASDTLTAFNSDGFTLGNNVGINGSSNNQVSWNWLANGAGSSNTAGTISSTVSVNTTSGFSIVSYTGNGTSGATFGHGLGVTPAFTLVKNRSTGGRNWQGFHKSLGNTKSHLLNSTEVPRTNIVFWNNTSPTSTLITLGNDADVNESGQTFIAYCFAEVKGFSKFGSYTGNGSTDGTFVYTGFRPALVLQKTTSTTSDWNIVDNKRSTYNVNNLRLNPNTSSAESTSPDYCDLLSNGFKFRASSSGINGSGETNIYAAFAENPLVGTNNVPATAR